ncbi:hypothetical protein HZA57_07580, partial [Candidatus Poribacteria bacterium]|nr:hypothetical protein [Candidatus Poribacteria bacterium]
IVSKPISRWHYLVGKYFGLLLTICINVVFMTFFFLAVLYLRGYTENDAINQALYLNPDGTYKESISAFAQYGYYLTSLAKSVGQALATLLTLGYYSTEVTQGIMAVSFLTMLEMAIVTAFAILFSSFSSPILSAFMTVIVFIIGRANQDVYYFADMMASNAGGMDKLSGGQVIAYHLSHGAAYIAPNLNFFNQRQRVADMLPPEISGYSIAYGVAYTVAVLIVASLIFNRRNFK